jgi:hypothetical protein
MTNKTAIQILDRLIDAYEAIKRDIDMSEKCARRDRRSGEALSAEGWKLRALGSKDALGHFHNAFMDIRHDILPNAESSYGRKEGSDAK